MKERNLKRTLSILVAIVLAFSSFFSNCSVAYAADTNGTTESSTVTAEKELVQCSNDWTIFKYKDEAGEPTFDIMYQNKSVEKLKNEGFELQYRIISRNDDTPIFALPWFNIENKTELEFPKNTCKVQFQLIPSDDDATIISTSDAFELECDDNSYASILNWNIECYNLTEDPNNFKLEIKVNKSLEEIENPSISINPYGYGINVDTLSSNTLISNITYEKHSNSYTIEGKTYTADYSIISYNINMPSSFNNPTDFHPDTGDAWIYLVDYTFLFNGFNFPIEDFSFKFYVPSFSYDVPVQSIRLHSPSSNIKANSSINLIANILPSNATNKKLNWYSSNEKYATIDENGVVTAKPAGAGKTVTITAKATDGSNIEGSYILNIENNSIKPKDILVKSIKISAPASKVSAGKTINLKASVNSDATNKSIVWSSSNTKYATVNSSGVVTTKKAGAGKTVTITAKAKDGSGKIATFKLKINKVLVKKIKLKAKKSIKVGKKLKIKLTISSDATNKAVKWSVNNKKYAKISSKGVLTAKKAGKGKTIKVTAKAKDGSGKKATIKIKIKK